jgi:hypothetical protein
MLVLALNFYPPGFKLVPERSGHSAIIYYRTNLQNQEIRNKLFWRYCPTLANQSGACLAGRKACYAEAVLPAKVLLKGFNYFPG